MTIDAWHFLAQLTSMAAVGMYLFLPELIPSLRRNEAFNFISGILSFVAGGAYLALIILGFRINGWEFLFVFFWMLIWFFVGALNLRKLKA